jgi:predicted RNase H-like nuclease (RuvC/YqgF family)
MSEETEAQETKVEKESFDRDYVEGLRGESAGYRKKLRESEQVVETLTKKLSKFESMNKSDLERLTEEKTALEKANEALLAKMDNSAVDTAILLAASKADVVDTDAVKALIDRSDIAVMDGKVVGVDKALKALFKDKPYLLAESEETPPPAAGVGGKPLTNSPKDVDEAFLGVLKAARRK